MATILIIFLIINWPNLVQFKCVLVLSGGLGRGPCLCHCVHCHSINAKTDCAATVHSIMCKVQFYSEL